MDHLGNIRLSYWENPTDGFVEILEENHYYPFGLKHSGYTQNTLQPNYQYKYNGKELQEELNLNVYDYGARNYDPAIGRWLTMDPLAEKMRRHSPYNYAFNNPIYFIDPDGMRSDGWIEQLDENGSKTYTYRSDINTEADAEAAGFSNVSGVSDSYSISNDNYGYKYNLNSDGTYTFNQGIFSSTGSGYDSETFTTQGGSTITGYKCTTCANIDRPIATNSIQYQMGSASGQLGVAAYYGLQTFGGIVAGEAVLGAVGLGGGISLSGYAAAGDALSGLGVQTSLKTLPCN